MLRLTFLTHTMPPCDINSCVPIRMSGQHPERPHLSICILGVWSKKDSVLCSRMMKSSSHSLRAANAMVLTVAMFTPYSAPSLPPLSHIVLDSTKMVTPLTSMTRSWKQRDFTPERTHQLQFLHGLLAADHGQSVRYRHKEKDDDIFTHACSRHMLIKKLQGG